MRLARWWFLTILAVCRVLVIDRVVLLHEFERRLVVEVLPLAAHPLMRLGKQGDCLAAPIAPVQATTDTRLRRFQRARSAFLYQPG